MLQVCRHVTFLTSTCSARLHFTSTATLRHDPCLIFHPNLSLSLYKSHSQSTRTLLGACLFYPLPLSGCGGVCIHIPFSPLSTPPSPPTMFILLTSLSFSPAVF